MCQTDDSYVPIKEKKNWCQALQYCRNNLMELARIDSEEENKEFKAKSQNGSFWIGLMHVLFEWDDQSCSTFRNIAKSTDPPENCAVFDQTGSVRQYGCTRLAKALCTKGTVRIQIVRENLTWENAIEYCEKHHSRLLWIEDEDDQDAVESWLKKTLISPNKPEPNFWIGLRQSTIFGFWIWSDRIVHWSNWEDGKMPELPMSHHCGVISGEDFKWRDEKCWKPLPFLCEEDIVKMKKNP
ncbi:tetranectin isoform X2 [Cololabis saira]|nr:tetranectin isoform X2 [Cololabis saira]